MRRALDRVIIAAKRRTRQRHMDRELQSMGVEVQRPRTLQRPAVRRAAEVAGVAAIIAASGVTYYSYGEHRAEIAAENQAAYYQQEIRERGQALEARDICAARAEARGESELEIAVGGPEIEACYADQEAEAARIRAEASTEGEREAR